MNTSTGDAFILTILFNIKNNGYKDRDAVKFLFDHLDHLSDSTHFKESADAIVRQKAIQWLEEQKIIKPKLLEYISI